MIGPVRGIECECQSARIPVTNHESHLPTSFNRETHERKQQNIDSIASNACLTSRVVNSREREGVAVTNKSFLKFLHTI